jgi:hypothetical protein
MLSLGIHNGHRRAPDFGPAPDSERRDGPPFFATGLARREGLIDTEKSSEAPPQTDESCRTGHKT